MKKVLTDAYCKALTPPATGRTEVADTRCLGLTFRMTTAGSRTWAFRFRDPVSRRSLRATIGTYPDIGLSDARAAADKLRGQVAAGVNPIDAKRDERSQAGGHTLEVLARRYLTEHAKRHKRPRSAEEDERNLNKHVLPKWAKRDYRKIRRSDVIALLEGIVAEGKHTAANRVQSLVSKIFSFAVDADLREDNPASRLRKRGTESTGKRVLADEEIWLFWRRAVLPPILASLV